MAEEREAGGFEAGARFGCEGVGDESGVADGFGGAPGGAVEHGAGVVGAVGGAAVDFEGPAVVGHAADWAADDNNSVDGEGSGVGIGDRDRELVAGDGFEVAVMGQDEGIGFLERDGDDAEGGGSWKGGHRKQGS